MRHLRNTIGIYVWLSILVAALLTSCVAEAQIVAFGASNVSGWNVKSSEAFPEQIQSMLHAKGYPVRVLNAGVYGNTTKEMLARLDTDVPKNTTIVILDTSGGNFNDRFQGLPEAETTKNMDEIVRRFKARSITIIPENSSQIPADLKQADGRHLTAEGHKKLAEEILPKVIEVLGPPPNTPMAHMMAACQSDAERLCANYLGNAEKRHACMHEHRSELSRDCKKAIVESKAASQ